MGTATDGIAAHGILLGFAPLSRHGACWYYVWRAYAAAGARTSQGSTPTAYAASLQTLGMHYGDRNPPAGAAIWLGRRLSDGNMDGDVFIAGGTNGDQSAATDFPGWGQTGLVSIQGRINQTGREYIGWSDHVLDCPILGAQPAPTPPDTEIEGEPMFIANVRGAWQVILPIGEHLQAVTLDGNSGAATSGIPVLAFTDEFAVQSLQRAVPNLVVGG